MYIYKVTNRINGKIYIGQSRYKNNNYLGSGVNIRAAVLKYGSENFVKEYIDEAFTQEELDKKEKHWIKETYAQNPNIGYNIADGGWNHLTITTDIKRKISATMKHKYDEGYINNRLGKTASDETKKKISEKLKGRQISNETKKKISEKLKGRQISKEARKKMSDAKKGNTLSTDHKKKIGEGLKGRPVSETTRELLRKSNINKTQSHSKKVIVTNIKTNDVLYFNNISQAARELGTHRSYIRNNKIKGFEIKLI